MWGTNSKSQKFQSNYKLPYDIGKTNTMIHNPLNNYSNNNEFNLIYQTPIKQFENIDNNNNCNVTPFRFDFNYYFGNLWSSGQIPNNQIIQQQLILSPTQLNKDNIPFYKKSIEKSYNLTPSQMKDSNSHNNSINNSNNKVIYNQNNDILSNNKLNELNNLGNYLNNSSNINDLSKKNLSDLFNNAKNETFLNDKNINKLDNINNNINNKNNKNSNNVRFSGKNEIKKKNYNLQISRQFIFSSPCIINKPKKIFECSGSTIETSSNRNINKNRRFRKNN